MRARLLGPSSRRRWLIPVLVAVMAMLASPSATASAARMYLAIGDSVGAGFGSTSGQSYFDRYCAYLESTAGGSLVDRCVNDSMLGLTTESALDGSIAHAVSQIDGSTDTPIVTVVLGGGSSSTTRITTIRSATLATNSPQPGCYWGAIVRSRTAPRRLLP